MDPSSYANINEVNTTHVHMALRVDFEATKLAGEVKLSLKVVGDGAERVTLDTRDLTITAVTIDGAAAEHAYGEGSAALGTPLHVTLPEASRAAGSTLELSIAYATSASASAVQFLNPAQTAGKTHPYMFTQCQAIHARSLLPCQDSPSQKITYSAAIDVPAELDAVMSAVREGASEPADGRKVVTYNQTQGIPSYLIALAVGNLVSRDIGPRSKVWSEPETVEAGAYEFAETELFVKTAEELQGPYVWGVYDILLLPPSFPYGGMENPCLTFVTPTLLAGDRSLADVITHEAQHSWSGNLVTSKTWEHFWLNEGFTMYMQRRILSHIHGEAYFDFDAMTGYKDLCDEIDHFGATNPLTALVPKLEGIDPDDAFSSVPYEKGFNFLYYLEKAVAGSPAAMEAWIKVYMQRFAGTSITTDDMVACFKEHFEAAGKGEALAAVDWDAWLYSPGHCPVKPTFDESLRAKCNDLADRWLDDVKAGGSGEALAETKAEFEAMSAGQRQAFLERLLVRTQPEAAAGEAKEEEAAAEARSASPLLSSAMLARMDALYDLTASRNSEIRFRWQTLCLRGGHAAILPSIATFLGEQGRMKFIRPLYRALFAASHVPGAKATALAVFKDNRANYHPIAAKMCASDLGVAEE